MPMRRIYKACFASRHCPKRCPTPTPRLPQNENAGQSPGVLNYACGPHIDVGRKNIRQDYTLGILVEFSTVDAYRAYQVNPEHVALIKKWKPKWSNSEMFDFGAP